MAKLIFIASAFLMSFIVVKWKYPIVKHEEIPSVSSLLDALPSRNVGFGSKATRISALAVYDKNPRIFYAGSGNGGVIKTTNGGDTWQFVFDRQGSANIGALAVSQRNPDVIWVGTGEKWQRNNVGRGDGIYKSMDGGKTWQHLGLENSNSISRISIDPKNENIVFVAVLGSPWGYGPDRGIYRTKDGGKTWKKVLYVNERTAGSDVIIDPKNSKNILAATWEHIHHPYGWQGGGPGSGIYRSTDGGDTWHKVTKGLPNVDKGMITLDYFSKDSKNVVADIEVPMPHSNIFRSMDGGESWKEMPGVHLNSDGNPMDSIFVYGSWGRAYYNQYVKFAPDDVNTIYEGYPGHVSKDGGKTFWGGTGDYHSFWIDPNNPHHAIYASDGGVSQTWDLFNEGPGPNSKGWPLWKTEPIPLMDQACGVGYDMRKLYWVMSNLQDGGGYKGPTQTMAGYITQEDCIKTPATEYGKSTADPNDWTTTYHSGYELSFHRLNIRTGEDKVADFGYEFHTYVLPSYVLLTGDLPSGFEAYQKQQIKIRVGWDNGWQISPWNSSIIYYGTNYLFKSVDKGNTFQIISPDLTHDKPEWQVPDGTIKGVETGANRAFQTIQTVCESSLKKDLIWVGTDDGYVQLTKDGGRHWENVTKNIPGLPEYTWVSCIQASHHVAGRAYAVFDGHKNFDLHTYVYVTDDYGKTWTKINGNLPKEQSCFVIREGLKNPDLLFLGTEFALYVSMDRGQSWAKYTDWKAVEVYGSGGYFPTVAVRDIEIHPRELDLIISTHGRGIWITPIRALEELTKANREKEVFFVSPGNVYLFPIVTHDSGVPNKFVTLNTQPGTLFSYYLKNSTKGKAIIKVFNAAGDKQYGAELTGSSKAGLNSIPWIATNIIKEPGDYRVVLTIEGKEYYQTLHVEDATNEVLAGAAMALKEKQMAKKLQAAEAE